MKIRWRSRLTRQISKKQTDENFDLFDDMSDDQLKGRQPHWSKVLGTPVTSPRRPSNDTP